MIRKSNKITNDKNYITVYHEFCTYKSKYEGSAISNCCRLDMKLDIKDPISRYMIFNIIITSGSNINGGTGEVHFNITSYANNNYRKVECTGNSTINKSLHGFFINPVNIYTDNNGYIHSIIDVYFVAPLNYDYYNGTFISVYHSNGYNNIINSIQVTPLKQDDTRYYPLETGDIVEFDNDYITYSNPNNNITLYNSRPTKDELIYISKKYDRLMFRSQYALSSINSDASYNTILISPLIYFDIEYATLNSNIYPMGNVLILKDTLDANDGESGSPISYITCKNEYHLTYIASTRTQYVLKVIHVSGVIGDNPLLICGFYRKKSSRFFDKIWDFLYKITKITNILTTFPFLKYKIIY